MSRIKILNIEVDNVNMKETLQSIDRMIRKGKPSYVVTPNINHVVALESDSLFREIYDKADLILTDGKPLIWYSRLVKRPIKAKISGSDLFPLLCKMAAKRGYKMYFLGAAEGVAAKAAENLEKKYPGLNVCGTYSPKFGFENDLEESQKINGQIKEAAPDILIVGLGAPKQEKFIYRNLEELNVPVSLGLGASLDFEAGNISRAPRWMANAGLEWLYRIIQDPKRLFKRYFFDGLKFIPIMIKYRKVK